MSRAFPVEVAAGERVTAIVYPAAGRRARIGLLLGHGAGADQRSDFMIGFATGLAARGLDVATFNFPYAEERRGPPDRGPRLEACYRAVVAAARLQPELAELPLAVGGKSLGGRIASQVVAAGLEGAAALVLLGYPLHPPRQPERLRAAHLGRIRVPMLFVQGARDPFGGPDELAPILAGAPNATVLPVAGGDHSLVVPRRLGRPQAEVYAEVQDAIVRWLAAACAPARR